MAAFGGSEEELCPLLNEYQESDKSDNSSQQNQLFNRKTRTFTADFEVGTQRQSTEREKYVDENHDNPHGTAADIVSIFVVAFDTKAGNMVEWWLPENSNIPDGIEFKAMASGSHRVTYDFIYFKEGPLFGLSCFENMPVDSCLERGARMKSVGILAASYRQLHHYKPFLEAQVTLLLKSPASYEHLREFYETRKGILLPSSRLIGDQSSVDYITRPLSLHDDFKITHPAGCFAQFVRFFGEHIFVLWKFVLLQKRILFFSPPPIGVVCYRVYCANCLDNHSIQELTPKTSNVMFYVNVADIDTLERENHYIACTTEKIFEGKSQLFDVYIDNQNIIVPTLPALREIASLTAEDKNNFKRLCNSQRDVNALSYSNATDGSENEPGFVSFFTNLNNELFRILLEASWSQEKHVTLDNFRRVGLDPNARGDRAFLIQLVDLYGIDVEIVADNPCCPV